MGYESLRPRPDVWPLDSGFRRRGLQGSDSRAIQRTASSCCASQGTAGQRARELLRKRPAVFRMLLALMPICGAGRQPPTDRANPCPPPPSPPPPPRPPPATPASPPEG